MKKQLKDLGIGDTYIRDGVELAIVESKGLFHCQSKTGQCCHFLFNGTTEVCFNAKCIANLFVFIPKN